MEGERNMIISLKGQLEDWKQGRSITMKFLSELSDSDLDKKLPRKNTNTIRLQMEDMVAGQEIFMDAITTKKGLFDKIVELDKKMEEILKVCDGTESINWDGKEMNIHAHISAMIGHEQMHLGQIIAFCYATGIPIPDEVTEEVGLTG
jgi:hypothetical protein